ncbi:Dyp-type peroxidase [Catenulispora pinisilvae]|uniref:Dyp-type peroxidase n=1 Tax=Catenulispora pinisilvae TaxID=2705253 RepID=UPI001891065E|nr:Dyp-type peroxidase [Catenulispora pinisilvae]
MPKLSPADAAQPVVSPLTSAAMFLVLTVEDGGEDAVREAVPDLSAYARAVGFGHPEAELACVTGFGSQVWDRLFDGPRPAELHPFIALDGPQHSAPSTPGDLLLHLRAQHMDVCYDFAANLLTRLGGAVKVVDEVHGFRYYDRRDLLGFVDGTENPEGVEAVAAALVDAERDPEFVGGSYVIVQKYLHDISAWNALSDHEQALVIGRTKTGNVQLPDAALPKTSHVSRNTIVGPDGEEQDILRANMPFGSFREGEVGTYFIGYCATPETTEQMLRNMFIGDEAGNRDRILDFSTAVTGGLFFVPPTGFLDDPPPAPGQGIAGAAADNDGSSDGNNDNSDHDTPTAPTTPAKPRTSDGSLGIGSLRS